MLTLRARRLDLRVIDCGRAEMSLPGDSLWHECVEESGDY